jgi:hypothetical protein
LGDVPNDPMFVLTFPQKEMLQSYHFKEMPSVIEKGDKIAKKIKR